MCDATTPVPGPAAGSWRTGGSLGRNLYVVAQVNPVVQQQIGMMQTPVLARRVVAAMELVREMAASDAPLIPVHADQDSCGVCGEAAPDHDAGCWWRLAGELMADG